MPERVQLSRKKGWKMPPNTVKVARPSLWGNPYPVERHGLELALRLFEDTVRGFWSPGHFDGQPDWLVHEAYTAHCAFRKRLSCHPMDAVSLLRGKNLACYCPLDQPCHADILLRLANPLHPKGSGQA